MEKTKRIGYEDNADIKDIDDNFKILDNVIDFNKSIVVINISNSNWTETQDADGAKYYIHKYTVENLTSDDKPIISIKIEDNLSIRTYEEIKKEFAKNFIYYECTNGKITLAFKNVPSRNYKIELKGIGA